MVFSRSFFDWAFERHQNQWSWYLRPLFLLPYAYFAYQRRFSGMMASVLALFTSMFWFPVPDQVSAQALEFLAFEQDYLQSEWGLGKALLMLTVPIAFWALGLAFWRRSLLMGGVVMAVVALAKITWSIINAQEAGTSIVVPALTGLAVSAGLLLIVYRVKKLRIEGEFSVKRII
jgi:hypothetical protein